jgi:hypothetical protein
VRSQAARRWRRAMLVVAGAQVSNLLHTIRSYQSTRSYSVSVVSALLWRLHSVDSGD